MNEIEKELTEGMNDPQIEGTLHTDGHLLVMAGAGSGKTRVLTHKIANLILNKHVKPNEITAITFTNKASAEMRERLAKLVGKEKAGKAHVATFHSLALHILMHYSTKRVMILDEDDRSKLIEKAMEMTKTDYITDVGQVKKLISTIKMYMIDENDNLDFLAKDIITQATIRATKTYFKLKKRDYPNFLDFDDLLPKVVNFLDKNPRALSKEQNKARYLLVDEFQDTNDLQYQFVRKLSEKYENLVVIGDPDQSIYGWRGSNVRIIYGFKNDYPDTDIVMLEQNYRSKAGILEAANKLISYNERDDDLTKLLWSDRRNEDVPIEDEIDEQVSIISYENEQDEANSIAEDIQRRSEAEGLALSNFAVLYRTNRKGDIIRKALDALEIRHTNSKDEDPEHDFELQAIIQFIRYLVYENETDLIEQLTRLENVGEGLINKLQDLVFDEGYSMIEAIDNIDKIKGARRKAKDNINEYMKLLIDCQNLLKTRSYNSVFSLMRESGIFEKNRLENVSDGFSARSAGEHDYDFEIFLNETELGIIRFENQNQKDSVIVMSIHQSKGLEFPNVYVIGNEKNSFPSFFATGNEFFGVPRNPDLVEEERRLEYVAITRAEKSVQLSYSREGWKFRNGKMELVETDPGEFIENLVQQGIEVEEQ